MNRASFTFFPPGRHAAKLRSCRATRRGILSPCVFVCPDHGFATGELAMRTLVLGLASLLVFGLTLAYGDEKKDDNKTKVVGVWEVVKGEAPKGATVEFTKDGKVKIAFEAEGKKITIDGA